MEGGKETKESSEKKYTDWMRNMEEKLWTNAESVKGRGEGEGEAVVKLAK